MDENSWRTAIPGVLHPRSASDAIKSLMDNSQKTSPRQSFGRKAWLFFRWMQLALAVAGLLVWGGVAAGPGMWRNILCGSALAIVASIGLWFGAPGRCLPP
jgi:hypothetical protein